MGSNRYPREFCNKLKNALYKYPRIQKVASKKLFQNNTDKLQSVIYNFLFTNATTSFDALTFWKIM